MHLMKKWVQTFCSEYFDSYWDIIKIAPNLIDFFYNFAQFIALKWYFFLQNNALRVVEKGWSKQLTL